MTCAPSAPKTGKAIETMLAECGISEYEPRLVQMLLDYSYKYIVDILEDARIFSEHAKKTSVDGDDVKLAIRVRSQTCFATPPDSKLIAELAAEKNSIPLPEVKTQYGISLPPDRYCLLQPNYKLKPSRQAIVSVPRKAHILQQQSLASPGVRNYGLTRPPVTPAFHVQGAPSSTVDANAYNFGQVQAELLGPPAFKRPHLDNIDEDYDAF